MPRSKYMFYVVWNGRQTGLFTSWSDCEGSVKGFPNAQYKGFKNRDEADAALKMDPNHFMGNTQPNHSDIITDSWCADAACNQETKVMSYRICETSSGKPVHQYGPFEDGTNNIGEFLAVCTALAFLKQEKSSKAIYTDSKTALAWIRNKKANSKSIVPGSQVSKLITRAETWLQNNNYENPILKWDTAQWGEIPADYGNK